MRYRFVSWTVLVVVGASVFTGGSTARAADSGSQNSWAGASAGGGQVTVAAGTANSAEPSESGSAGVHLEGTLQTPPTNAPTPPPPLRYNNF